MAYQIVLLVHSWLRWGVLILAAVAAGQATVGWLRGRDFSAADQRAGLLFIIALDTQVLLGLALYLGLSPITSAALAHMHAAMKNPVLRFWAVEHTTAMFAVLIIAHVGRVLARRATAGTARLRRTAIATGLALLLLLAGNPWPFLPYGRALFRF